MLSDFIYAKEYVKKFRIDFRPKIFDGFHNRFLFIGNGKAQKLFKMTEIGKSKIHVLINVGYYLSDLKVSDLNSYVFSHGTNTIHII